MKIADIKKDIQITRKSVPNKPLEIESIDIEKCDINPLGTTCKYSLYNKALQKIHYIL